jgi:hypothetical protein
MGLGDVAAFQSRLDAELESLEVSLCCIIQTQCIAQHRRCASDMYRASLEVGLHRMIEQRKGGVPSVRAE